MRVAAAMVVIVIGAMAVVTTGPPEARADCHAQSSTSSSAVASAGAFGGGALHTGQVICDAAPSSGPAASSAPVGLPPGHYESKPVCALGGAQTCGVTATCASGETLMEVWYQADDGQQLGLHTTCGKQSVPAGPSQSPGPQVDPSHEFKQVQLPDSVLHFQPADNQTLVNFKSNYYVDAGPFETTLHLLNGGATTIDFKIAPTEFDWTFGDGTTLKTSTPGAPYPNLQVTHEYAKAGVVQAHVDTVWGAQYRVNGGAWGPVDGTVTKTGADVSITVRQATPVLTD